MPRSAAWIAVSGLLTATHSGGCGFWIGLGRMLRVGQLDLLERLLVDPVLAGRVPRPVDRVLVEDAELHRPASPARRGPLPDARRHPRAIANAHVRVTPIVGDGEREGKARGAPSP